MNFDLLSVATVIANIAIAFTLLEGLALLVVHRLTGRGLEPQDFLLNLLAGICLMLAIRAALGAAWTAIPLFLIASGAMHGCDIALRLRRKSRCAAATSAGPNGR